MLQLFNKPGVIVVLWPGLPDLAGANAATRVELQIILCWVILAGWLVLCCAVLIYHRASGNAVHQVLYIQAHGAHAVLPVVTIAKLEAWPSAAFNSQRPDENVGQTP
jgi:hypothetical protein